MHRRSFIGLTAYCLLVLYGCAAVPADERASADKKALEPRYAEYLAAWTAQVERVGNANFPVEARGLPYSSVRLAVTVKPDGSVEAVKIERSSGSEVLDRAAMRIVRLASPFAPFPPEIRKDTDVLVITRTWTFTPREWIEVR